MASDCINAFLIAILPKLLSAGVWLVVFAWNFFWARPSWPLLRWPREHVPFRVQELGEVLARYQQQQQQQSRPQTPRAWQPQSIRDVAPVNASPAAAAPAAAAPAPINTPISMDRLTVDFGNLTFSCRGSITGQAPVDNNTQRDDELAPANAAPINAAPTNAAPTSAAPTNAAAAPTNATAARERPEPSWRP